MKKKIFGAIGAVVLILAMVFSLGGWSLPVPYSWIMEPGPVILTPEQEKQAEAYAKQNEQQSVGMPNPFVDCKTMKDAEKIAGFSFTVPKSIKGYPNQSIQAIKNDLIQVFYTDKNDNEILLRKAKGNSNITGDYNTYKDTKTKTIDGKKVTINRKDGKVYSAYWVDGNYSYAVDALDQGVSEKLLTQLVSEMK